MKAALFPFWNAGMFMAFPMVFSTYLSILKIPIPAVLSVSIIVSLTITIQLISNISVSAPKIRFVVLLYMAYLFLAVYSYKQTSDFQAPEEKIIYIFYVISLPISLTVFSFFLTNKRLTITQKDVDRTLYRVFNLATIFFSVSYLFFREFESEGRYIVPGVDNPIWVSRQLSVGLLVFFVYNVYYRKSIDVFRIIIISFLFLLAVDAGARGPIVAFLVSVLFFFFWQKKINYRKCLYIFMPLTLLLAALYNYSDSYVFTTTRYSIGYREAAWDYILNIPVTLWGHGLGMYGWHYYGIDSEAYPHNLFAELYFEFGVVGLIFSVIFLIIVLRSHRTPLTGCLVIYYFINAMFSGNVIASYPLFIAVVLAVEVRKRAIDRLV